MGWAAASRAGGRPCAALTAHHEGEDRHLFPAIAEQYPGLRDTLYYLRQDHSMIAHLLAGLQAAVARAAPPAELHRHLEGRPVVSDCRAVGDGEVCKVWEPVAASYWLAALLLAYAVIAGGYLRVARARGVEARVLPYVLTGVALTVLLFAAVAAGAGAWIVPDPQALLDPSTFVQVLFRLLTPAGGIGLALLVLASLERHVALLVFAVGYLAVVLVPITFGWGEDWGSRRQFAPMLVMSGGVLLVGSAGFALAQRLRRPR